jgi:hypothetical protein
MSNAMHIYPYGHLCGMEIYPVKMSLILVGILTVVLLTVHLPEALPPQTSKMIFDASPARHSVMVVPRLASSPS